MSINNMEQLLVELKLQIRKLLATGATARAARTVRAEVADSSPGPGRRAPVNSSIQSWNPHNFINIKYLSTNFLP
jgi:hypothetical protein